MISLYEENILNQIREWKRILNLPLPSTLYTINPTKRRTVFVGIGSSYWAARFSEFLWKEFVNPDCISLLSYDFARSKYLISTNDIFVIFSHRGTKTFSIQSLDLAKKSGATTVLVTGRGSPDNLTPTTTATTPDIRIETCAQENCGAFTISLTSALVRMIQWIGLSNKDIIETFKQTIESIQLPMKMENHLLPKFLGNLVIVGDLIREVVAHEVALKISETCYIPVRSFGLEQFLHGPRVTLDKQSSLVAFTSITEPRKDSLIKYAETIETEVIEINENTFHGVPKEFSWLAQLLYGQQLALELSKKLGTDPDTVRADQSPYKEARNLLTS
ncbi:MAG: SIS domain-containing protein [Thermoproteota archaeon]|nr:SIS domain-containing protein [Thermoproteota archaeon]